VNPHHVRSVDCIYKPRSLVEMEWRIKRLCTARQIRLNEYSRSLWGYVRMRADEVISASSGPTDAATVVQNFLNSLKGGNGMQQQQAQGQIYTTLPDLLSSSTTIPAIESASASQIDNLLSYLPPTILLLAQESAASIDGMVEPNAATATAAMEALSVAQKKSIVKRVLRSPQFHQSLGSLTMAIRDGGLPSIADALGVQLENGGLVRGGSMPLGGGDAVEAFVEGVKRTVEGKK
jgi:26S proteasome regulatory subunit N13